MAKYDPLREHLAATATRRVEMTFDEIGALVGGLPRSAHEYREWWANEASGTHTHARAWSSAGYRVEDVNLIAKRVRFVKL